VLSLFHYNLLHQPTPSTNKRLSSTHCLKTTPRKSTALCLQKEEVFSIALLNALIKNYQTKPHHYQSSEANSPTPNQGIEKSNSLSRNPFAGIKRHTFYRASHG